MRQFITNMLNIQEDKIEELQTKHDMFHLHKRIRKLTTKQQRTIN